MGVVLLLLALLAAGVALLALQRRRQRTRLRPASPTLFTLALGDLVQFDGRDWVVENRLAYDEDGFSWLEYLLQDGTEQGWLSVEEDDWLELGWFQPVRERDALASLPPLRTGVALPPTLRWRGRDYSLCGHGRASLVASLRALPQARETCRYGDYEAADGSLLALELWEGGAAGRGGELEPELAEGRRLDPSLLTLLPGDGRSVYRGETAPLPGP